MWVIIDGLTKLVYLITIKNTMSIDQLGQIYMKEIVRLHSVPKIIVSYQDTKFISTFWQSMQRSLGTRLAFNIAYHP